MKSFVTIVLYNWWGYRCRKKIQRSGRNQKGPEAEAPLQGKTLVVPADVQRSDTMEENQLAAQQETQTAEESMWEEKAHQGASGRGDERRDSGMDQGKPHVSDFPDHARLPPTVFTTTERPPDDLKDLVTFPHDQLLFPITPDCFEKFKTVWNTSIEFTDLPGPYQTSHRPFPTSHRPYTTFPGHQGRERSASKSAKCDQGLT